MPKLTIIIPVFNEAERIRETLTGILTLSDIEIIVVDGGSSDRTVSLAAEIGVKAVICPNLGRAAQMNYGATLAHGDILLFLHADTQLPANFQDWVREILGQSGVMAGAFELQIEGKQWGLRLIESLVNLRSRFCSLPYGDQAIFVKKQIFEEMGGFPQLPIMEDFELIRRLKRQGKIAIAPIPVITSGRRWQKLGIVKTTIINQIMIMGYFLGISPEKLAIWYRKPQNNLKNS